MGLGLGLGLAVLGHLVEGRGRGEIGRDVDLDKVRRELSIEQDVEAEDLKVSRVVSQRSAVVVPLTHLVPLTGLVPLPGLMPLCTHLEARVAPSEALAVARADVRLCGDEGLQADTMNLRRGTVRMVSVSVCAILLLTTDY